MKSFSSSNKTPSSGFLFFFSAIIPVAVLVVLGGEGEFPALQATMSGDFSSSVPSEHSSADGRKQSVPLLSRPGDNGVGDSHISSLRYLWGTLCVALNIMSSTAFMLIVQAFGSGKNSGPLFDKPWLEVILYHVGMAILIPVALVWRHVQAVCKKESAAPPIPWRALWIWGFLGGPVLIFSAFLNYLSLSRMPLYVNNTLVNLIFVFVFAMSAVFLKEPITIWKVLGSLTILGGLAAEAVGSVTDNSTQNTVFGYVFLFGTITLSTLYFFIWTKLMVVECQRNPDQRLVLSMLGMGFIGVVTILLGWIGCLIANYSGLEPFAWPEGPALTRVLSNMGLDVVINVSNLAGVLFVSATFVTVVGLLQIPVSLFAQSYFEGATAVNALQAVGVVLVGLGVLVFELAELIVNAIKTKVRRSKPGIN